MYKKFDGLEIFATPLTDIYPDDGGKYGGYNFVSAPLANEFMILDDAAVCGLERAAAGETVSPEIAAVMKKLCAGKIRPAERKKEPPPTSCLVYLLNQKCNFSCRYCYSAKGRSTRELDEKAALGILEEFFRKFSGRQLTISFGGGGDPLMSWPLMKKILYRSRELQAVYHVVPEYNMTTNGSLFTQEIIDVFKEFGMEVQVSFEILPEIQNAQRGSFDRVAANIDLLTANGIIPSISAVITPLSVDRQLEMVKFCRERFPALPHASFDYVKDYVKDLSMCDNILALKNFLTAFYDNFYEAKKFAAENGFRLTTPLEKIVHSCKPYNCHGNVAVTASGMITACPRVSAPQEEFIDELTIGSLDENGNMNIFPENWKKWCSWEWTKYPQCASCPIKWNCGGGCPLENLLFPAEFKEVVCEFHRTFTARRLIAEKNLLEQVK